MTDRIAPWLPGLGLLLLWWAGWFSPLMPVALWAIQILGVLLAVELLAALTGDAKSRALLRYRWHSRRGRAAPKAALHLAQVYGLIGPTPLPPALARDAFADMTARAVQINLRHPNPLCGPLTLRRLSRALDQAQSQLGSAALVTRSPVPLSILWPQVVPGFSVGGVVLDLRRMAGGMLFRRMSETVRHAIAGERALRRRMPALVRPQDRWLAPDFPQHEIFHRASRLSVAAGLSPWNEDASLLPLRSQFRLAAVTLLLTGAPHAIRNAQVLAPFDRALLEEVVADLDRWAAVHGHHPLAAAEAARLRRAVPA